MQVSLPPVQSYDSSNKLVPNLLRDSSWRATVATV
jgi:hypothetical protein